MKRRLAKGAIILGLAALLGDAVLAYLKRETELKFVDVTSGNPRWVRPVATRFDEFAGPWMRRNNLLELEQGRFQPAQRKL